MGGTDKWKMEYLLFVSLVYLVYLNTATGSVMTESRFSQTSLDFSMIPNKSPVLEEEHLSIVSCGAKCSWESQCVGFGYRKQPSSACVLVIQGVSEEPVSINLDGFTYYHMENRALPMDCQDYPYQSSGTYLMQTTDGQPIVGRCERVKGVNWLVFHRRMDGSENFNRNWTDYRLGFGHPSGEFWFGNENVHQLTKDGNYTLRIELMDPKGVLAVVEYDTFIIGDESSNYKLTVGGYDGSDPPDDSLYYHHTMAFTTGDRDNDFVPENCGLELQSGWWFRGCQMANLNGDYGNTNRALGVNWYAWRGYDVSLPSASMMIKRKQPLGGLADYTN